VRLHDLPQALLARIDAEYVPRRPLVLEHEETETVEDGKGDAADGVGAPATAMNRNVELPRLARGQ
jgi:hypothetical protein